MASFRVHDTHLGVDIEPTQKTRHGSWSDKHARPSFHQALNLLRGMGFEVTNDERYRSIRKSHLFGVHASGLRFYAEVYPRGWRIEFYQNIVHENPNGGRYDFSKLRKMPYLIRLRFWLCLRRVIALLRSFGMEDHTTPERGDFCALDMIRWHITVDNRWHFKGGDPLVDWRPDSPYNMKDRDGKTIEPGQVKWFYSSWNPRGALMRGRVYYNLNNMWWVVLNERDYTNLASHELFDWTPETPRRRPLNPEQLRKKLEQEQCIAVKAANYERAIVLRDLLKREVAA